MTIIKCFYDDNDKDDDEDDDDNDDDNDCDDNNNDHTNDIPFGSACLEMYGTIRRLLCPDHQHLAGLSDHVNESVTKREAVACQ